MRRKKPHKECERADAHERSRDERRPLKAQAPARRPQPFAEARDRDRARGVQVRLECRRTLVAVFRTPLHGPKDDLLGLRRYRGIEREGSDRVAGDPHLRGGPGVLGPEGKLPGQHLVKDHAQAVDVRALVIAGVADLLRRHVLGRAEERCQRAEEAPGRLYLGGQAEVHQAEPLVAADHDVRGLQVPVDDPAAVHVPERPAHDARNPQRVLLRHGPDAVNHQGEGAAVQELCHDVGGRLLVASPGMNLRRRG